MCPILMIDLLIFFLTGSVHDDSKEGVLPGGGGGHSLIWPIWGRAAGQGMVFDLSTLNRVYNFM